VKHLEVAVRGAGYDATLVEAPAPVPAADEVLVEVAASGVNRADLHQIAGGYPPPAGEPAILGLELSGTVVGTGEPVCALVAGGAHAELAAVPRGQIMKAPSGLALTDAAAIPEAFLTAYLNLVIEGGLGRGGAALVHAGASGVGLAAIQTARRLGARVAATTRSPEKVSAMRAAGADPVIATGRESFADALERAWGKDAVDVILDPIGAETLAGDLRVLAREGRVVFLATMSGSRTELDVALLMGKRGRLIGSTLRSRPRPEKARLVERFRAEIMPGFDAGELSVAIDSRFPPERAAEAFARMRGNLNTGKILIEWRGSVRESG
jgi:putative PIG3 family NAD(P)H quinone oxidoreductase